MTTTRTATKLEAIQALKDVDGFIGWRQLACVSDLMRGEEKQFYYDKMVELASRIHTMPKTYEQDGLGMKAIAYLHYFTGGCDWYITEKDMETLDEPGQHQAFGWANLGDPDCAELGYISIVELLAHHAELDFHFTPKPLAQLAGKDQTP